MNTPARRPSAVSKLTLRPQPLNKLDQQSADNEYHDGDDPSVESLAVAEIEAFAVLSVSLLLSAAMSRHARTIRSGCARENRTEDRDICGPCKRPATGAAEYKYVVFHVSCKLAQTYNWRELPDFVNSALTFLQTQRYDSRSQIKTGSWLSANSTSPLALLLGTSKFRVDIMVVSRAYASAAFLAAPSRSLSSLRSFHPAQPRPP